MPVPGIPRRMMPATAASPSAAGTPCRLGPSSPVASTPWQLTQFCEKSSLPCAGSSGPRGAAGMGGGAWARAVEASSATETNAQASSAVVMVRPRLTKFTQSPAEKSAATDITHFQEKSRRSTDPLRQLCNREWASCPEFSWTFRNGPLAARESTNDLNWAAPPLHGKKIGFSLSIRPSRSLLY